MGSAGPIPPSDWGRYRQDIRTSVVVSNPQGPVPRCPSHADHQSGLKDFSRVGVWRFTSTLTSSYPTPIPARRANISDNLPQLAAGKGMKVPTRQNFDRLLRRTFSASQGYHFFVQRRLPGGEYFLGVDSKLGRERQHNLTIPSGRASLPPAAQPACRYQRQSDQQPVQVSAKLFSPPQSFRRCIVLRSHFKHR